MLPALRVDPAYFIYFGKEMHNCLVQHFIYQLYNHDVFLVHEIPVTLRSLVLFAGLFVFVGVFFLTAILLAIVVDSYW